MKVIHVRLPCFFGIEVDIRRDEVGLHLDLQKAGRESQAISGHSASPTARTRLVEVVDVGLPLLRLGEVEVRTRDALRRFVPSVLGTVELIPLVEVGVVLGDRRVRAAGINPVCVVDTVGILRFLRVQSDRILHLDRTNSVVPPKEFLLGVAPVTVPVCPQSSTGPASIRIIQSQAGDFHGAVDGHVVALEVELFIQREKR